MDNILGDRPSTVPPVVLDSLETEKEVAAELENSDLEDERDKEVEERDEADYRDEDETASLTSSTASISSSNTSKASTDTINKKRKRPRQDSAVSELLQQIITIQSKSDERMIDLQEKQMKMEKRLMEKRHSNVEKRESFKCK